MVKLFCLNFKEDMFGTASKCAGFLIRYIDGILWVACLFGKQKLEVLRTVETGQLLPET